MNLPSWNLKEFYPSFRDKSIIDDLKLLENKTLDFSKKNKEKLDGLKDNKLLFTLQSFEEIEELSLKLRSYAYLVYCTDQLSNEKSKFYQNIEEAVLKAQKNIIFYGIELNKLNKDKISIFKKTKYKSWIENHKKFEKFQKSEKEEMILTEKSVTSSSAWIRFFDQTMTRLKFRLDGKDYTETEILSFFSSSNKALRKKIGKNIWRNTKK